MPNPYWDESLRGYTGRDKPIADFFALHKDKVDCFLGAAETLVRQSIDEYLKDGRDHLQVAFGCTGNAPAAKLNGSDWARLLCARSMFLGRCDWRKLNDADWSKLTGRAWVDILIVRPELADKCNWGSLNGANWADLLVARPEFSIKCDWRQLDGYSWADLLSRLPQYAESCDWGKFNGANWARLLREQPQFANKCDWEKLYWCSPEIVHYCWEDPDYSVDQSQSFCWADLLATQPQFADKCDWGRLSGKEWAMLLRWLPQYANKCDWGKLYEQATVKVEFESGCCGGECENCGNQAVCTNGYYEEPFHCYRLCETFDG